MLALLANKHGLKVISSVRAGPNPRCLGNGHHSLSLAVKLTMAGGGPMNLVSIQRSVHQRLSHRKDHRLYWGHDLTTCLVRRKTSELGLGG